MSNTFFEINKELFFKGRGSLVKIKHYMENPDLASCIKECVEIYKEISDEYVKSVGGDSAIIGIERSNVLHLIDAFFNMLILIWKYMSLNDRETNIRIENEKGGFLLRLYERDFTWEAEGRISPGMIKPIKNFTKIFNDKLSPGIQSFLRKYREVSKDKMIDAREMVLMQEELKQVIYYTLFLRIQIEYCLINK